MALFNDAVTVLRAPLVEDAYGHHRDWEQAVTLWSGPGALLPYRRALATHPAERETTLMRGTLYLSGAVQLDSADHVLVNGLTYQGAGEPWRWSLGSRVYTELFVVRVTK